MCFLRFLNSKLLYRTKKLLKHCIKRLDQLQPHYSLYRIVAGVCKDNPKHYDEFCSRKCDPVNHKMYIV